MENRSTICRVDVSSRAWAETQKTLGMTSAANLRAPRKLLTIQRNDTTSNDETKSKDGPDAAVAESSFAGPFWASRIMIEEAMTAVMKVEDKLSSNSNNDDEEDELEELRELLGNALKLPSDFDIKEEGCCLGRSSGSVEHSRQSRVKNSCFVPFRC